MTMRLPSLMSCYFYAIIKCDLRSSAATYLLYLISITY